MAQSAGTSRSQGISKRSGQGRGSIRERNTDSAQYAWLPRSHAVNICALPRSHAVRDLVYGRRYLPPTVELLAKPVAAVGGDHVCIRDRVLFINGAVAGHVLFADREGKPIPNHSVCRALGAEEVFLVTAHDNSFDSRNFGPVRVDAVKGTLSPLLTFQIFEVA